MPLNAVANKLGVLDFETDPFKIGRVPFPFAACVYFSETSWELLWDTDSRIDFIDRVIHRLKRMPTCTVYAHNGGRFDFHYMLDAAESGTVQIRSGRVTQFQIGRVTLKDSFPLMPFALEEYKKTKIDYAIFEAHRRNKPHNRKRIEGYLFDDCKYLHELLTGFRKIVGPRDTIGSAAFFQMRKLGIPIQSLNETHDEMFRPYYFGGRVQAFEKGLLNGPFKYYDINSAYPFAMRSNHAHGAEYAHKKTLPARDKIGPCFVHAIVESNGAIPLRSLNGTLEFPNAKEIEAYATGWEVLAGLDTKTLRVRKILDVWQPLSFINFSEYVDRFFALRQEAKKTGDAVKRLAYKYLLNSGYGKFAQNPRDFKEYVLAPIGKAVRGFDWETDFGAISLWSRSSYHGWGFFDVATGASITGFVRAKLWRAICQSSRPVYCDTDAIICRDARIERGDALGAWKLEGLVKRVAVAGKKLYGLEWAKPMEGKRHKIASKGARLSWSDMLQLCKGESIIWTNAAPTFAINGAHFIKREIRST